MEADLVSLSVFVSVFIPAYQWSSCQVEAEMILMTGEEAEKQPAGLGREDPNALEKPTWVDRVDVAEKVFGDYNG